MSRRGVTGRRAHHKRTPVTHFPVSASRVKQEREAASLPLLAAEFRNVRAIVKGLSSGGAGVDYTNAATDSNPTLLSNAVYRGSEHTIFKSVQDPAAQISASRSSKALPSHSNAVSGSPKQA